MPVRHIKLYLMCNQWKWISLDEEFIGHFEWMIKTLIHLPLYLAVSINQSFKQPTIRISTHQNNAHRYLSAGVVGEIEEAGEEQEGLTNHLHVSILDAIVYHLHKVTCVWCLMVGSLAFTIPFPLCYAAFESRQLLLTKFFLKWLNTWYFDVLYKTNSDDLCLMLHPNTNLVLMHLPLGSLRSSLSTSSEVVCSVAITILVIPLF